MIFGEIDTGVTRELNRGAIGRRIAIVLLLATAFAPRADAAAPKSLVVERGPIHAFAQDGSGIAWVGGRCAAVHVRSLPNGQSVVVGSGAMGPYSISPCAPLSGLVLGLGGRRAVWGGVDDQCCNNAYGAVRTGAPGTRSRALEDLWRWVTVEGPYLTGASGDGATLVYAIANVRWLNAEPCVEQEAAPCQFQVIGGGVRRVVGRTRSRIPGTPPAVLVAASAGRIVLVPADRTVRTSSRPTALANGPVEIRNAAGGGVVATFSPVGTVTAVAFSGRTAAVLVADAIRGKRIERYDATTGAPLGETSVPAETAPELDMAGTRIVFRAGRAIRLLDAATGAQRLLWTPRRRPIGVSIEGRRVAWAENARVRGRTTGRIRAIVVR